VTDGHDATFYRTALLLGLVPGADVHRWAEQAIEHRRQPHDALFDIVSVPADDLTGLRNALWPLAIDPEPAAVLHRIFDLLHEDMRTHRREPADILTILRQMRSMLRLPPAIYANLNAMLVEYAKDHDAARVMQFLSQP